METKSGAQISQKSFFQSLVILLVLMLAAGLLTLIIPPGQYERQDQEGRTLIVPDSFSLTERPDYPIWRWFTAPFEVLAGEDGLTIIVIIIFLLMVGTAFAVLDKSGLVRASLGQVVARFADQKYTLLLVIIFFFMSLGAFFGIFEEVVPLVPLMIALSYSLGWDTLVGLGMSILATNVGFSAAVTNPFTIGVAQKLAELPLFSGSGLRIVIFVICYLALAVFLTRYARKVERNPQLSPVYSEDQKERQRYAHIDFARDAQRANLRRSGLWIAAFLILILVVLIGAPFVPGLSDYSLPIVGLLFFVGGVGAGFLSGAQPKLTFQAMLEGATGIAPAIPLVLMAASVKFIVAAGGIMDTILHAASGFFSETSPFIAALLIYAIALVIEFFIGSGSAKAVLLMPILLPLADLVGVTRQVAVTAYCFGDGFSNLAYPTNPVLLICLGLTVVTYPKWIKWLIGMWVWIILITIAFLALATAIQYGPF
jgi:uncharacterized ion transporter superfamily protein YfcC